MSNRINKDNVWKESDPEGWKAAETKALKEQEEAAKASQKAQDAAAHKAAQVKAAQEERLAAQRTFETETKPEIEKAMVSLNQEDKHLSRLVSQGNESAQVVHDANMSQMVSRAEELKQQIVAAQNKLDDLYKGLNDAKWNKDGSAATDLLAQVPEVSKAIQSAEKAAASLRQLEAVAEGTKLGNLANTASQALDEARATLKAAKAAGVPEKEIAQLEKFVKETENSFNRARNVANTAKKVSVNDQVVVGNAIDESCATGRQLEQSLKGLKEESKIVEGKISTQKPTQKPTQQLTRPVSNPAPASRSVSPRVQDFVTNGADGTISAIEDLKLAYQEVYGYPYY